MTNQPYFKYRFLACISIFFPLIYFIYSILRIKWWQDNFNTLKRIYGDELVWRSGALLTINNIVPIVSNASLPVMFNDIYEITKQFNPDPKIPKSIKIYRIFSYFDIFLSSIRVLTALVFIMLFNSILNYQYVNQDRNIANYQILIVVTFAIFIINFILYLLAYLQMRTEIKLYDNLSKAVIDNENDYKKFLENQHKL